MLNFFKKSQGKRSQPFQLSNLIEILQDGVCITNINGEIIYLNKAGYALLGLENVEDLSQFNFLNDFIKKEEIIHELKQQLNKFGLVTNKELKLYRIGSGQLDVLLTVNLIGDFRQQTIGFLFLFKDITELKKIQDQLLQSQKLESIGLMASGIAHDFNNVLAAIIPNAELIKLSTPKGSPNYKRAEIIEKSAHRASDIAQRLLTFTRQKDSTNLYSIDLNQVVYDSLELLKPNIPGNIKVQTRLSDDLYSLKGDETEMQQIIMNLVINAVDAMPNGGIIVIKTDNFHVDKQYQLGSLTPGPYVHLMIRDTGTGIPLEIMPKIFDPFFTTKEIGKGTGLGLSVVYGIVRGMNGYVDVHSKMGEWTRFDLYFPAEGEYSAPAPKPVEHEQVKPNELTLLLVDDEDYVLNVLGDILEFLGYHVVKKNSGREALKYYLNHQQNINYVIIDMKMPDWDGKTTLEELRKVNPNIKVILTSGIDEGPIDHSNLHGVLGFLRKPYSINQVSKSMEEILSR